MNVFRAIILVSLSFVATDTVANNAVPNEARWFEKLFEYALFSNSSYQTRSEIEKSLNHSGYKITSYGELPGYGVGYILATNHQLKQQIIVVRGTSNIENAMVDVAFNLMPNKKTGIKLHQGFALSADLIYESIKNNLLKGYSINTTGHSLGGAAALILAMYINSDGFHTGQVITFGQPKVTNINGARKYSHLNVTRVVMPKDVVPLVPPFDPMDMMNMDIYWHLGTEIILQDANAYSQLDGFASMMRAADFFNEMISEKNLQHHYMSLYIKSLSQKLKNPRYVPYKNKFNINNLFGG